MVDCPELRLESFSYVLNKKHHQCMELGSYGATLASVCRSLYSLNFSRGIGIVVGMIQLRYNGDEHHATKNEDWE